MQSQKYHEDERELKLVDIRNPYLVDYERQKASHRVKRTLEKGNVRKVSGRKPVSENNRKTVRRSGTARQRDTVRQREEFRRREAVRQREKIISKRREAARQRKLRRRRLKMLGTLICVLALAVFIRQIDRKPEENVSVMSKSDMLSGDFKNQNDDIIQGLSASKFSKHPYWTEDFLTINEYSRPGEPLPEVKNIFVHYTANKNTSAAQNRSYFENLKDNHDTSASAHFIIGYNGEIIQCIPLNEIAYAVQTRNYDSISIECCYKADNGSFTQETYDSLLSLLRWLLDVYDLQPEDILRHYDCGGKKCPLYYTENSDAWEKLKKDVGKK